MKWIALAVGFAGVPGSGPLYDKLLSVYWADAGKHYAVREGLVEDAGR
jgi:hypothetical protein